jgi:hypothetical protein
MSSSAGNNYRPFAIITDKAEETIRKPAATIGLSIPLSYYPYKIDPHILHIIGKRNKELSDPGYLLLHLKDDVLELEKFIKNEKYRNEVLEESWNRYKITDLYELEGKIKEKLGIPKHSSIRWDKVKCSKTCKHTHQYFYPYFRDPDQKKLKKKYIGKQLPLPMDIKIIE